MFRSSAGCIPRLLREEGAALERLDDQVVGDVAREAQVDGRVDERLHDQEDVRRAGAADARSPSRRASRRRPRARSPSGAEQRCRPAPRCSAVVSGVAYQTVMPLPRRAGRVAACCGRPGRWPRDIPSARSSWHRPGCSMDRAGRRRRRRRRARARRAASICGLMRQQDRRRRRRRRPRCWRPTRMPYVALQDALAGRPADGWPRPGSGVDRASREGRPAIMASAMTPEADGGDSASVSGIGSGVYRWCLRAPVR